MVEEPPRSVSSWVFFSPSVEMRIERMAFSLLPGTTIPRAVAAQGVTTGDDRPTEPALVVAFDFPQQKGGVVSKPVQETRDVDAFLGDLLHSGRITRPSIVNPNDPPDVLACIDGTEVGIEATQLIPPDSELDQSNSIVGRWMTFERFRSKVLEQDPNTLAQHRGLLTVMHFGDLSSASPAQRLPPKRANLDSAIVALRTAEPIVRDGNSAASPNPNDVNLNEVIRWSSDKSVFFTWAALPPWYASPFRSQMGFELALGYHATLTRSELRDELRRVIADHDSEQTEILVVTVNAPLRSGLEFPTNELIAEMLFEDEQPLNGWMPSHVKRVALHNQGKRTLRWILGSNSWA
jgi:hypothetical protein